MPVDIYWKRFNFECRFLITILAKVSHSKVIKYFDITGREILSHDYQRYVGKLPTNSLSYISNAFENCRKIICNFLGTSHFTHNEIMPACLPTSPARR